MKLGTRIAIGVAAVGGLAAIVGGWYLKSPRLQPGVLPAPATALSAAEIEQLRPKVDAFCGYCHASPDPAIFAKADWFKEVERGFAFHFEAVQKATVAGVPPHVVEVPPMNDVVNWYRSQAPDILTIPEAAGSAPEGPFRFSQSAVNLPEGIHPAAVSHLYWDRSAGSPARILVTDMENGVVASVSAAAGDHARHLWARLDNPAHIEPSDLDLDGVRDYLVCDLGSFQPADHDKGRIVWLRPKGEQEFDPIVLADGLGRMADARPADFDGDGDVDVVAAEFGWHNTGRILLFDRTGTADGRPVFETRVVDPRHGAIHVPVIDLDGDGRLDFLGLVSQEFEVVEAYLNQGSGSFQKKTIHDAADASHGSSGIELVDLDRDGDLDVLATNGDTFDSHIPKPYHGVRWLENRGEFPFVEHHLLSMPGAYRALAADLDGDGDLDVIAAAFLDPQLRDVYNMEKYESIVALEQTEPGRFVSHRLLVGNSSFAAMEVGDFDADGDQDFVVGDFRHSNERWMTFWWNMGTPAVPLSEPSP
jgi:hypothetical protein